MLHAIRRRRLPLLSAVLLLSAAGPAAADGGFLAPEPFLLREVSQAAVLVHDRDAGRETLHLLPRFAGDADEFAWLVPLPAVPDIAAAPPGLMPDLYFLTQAARLPRDDAWNCDREPDYLIGAPDGGDVEVVGQELIGVLDVLTVTAANAGVLTDSLDAWGFLHDLNRAVVLPVLQDYVERQWCFVAMRVDSAALAALDPSADGSYDGWIQPMRFEFASAEPVYPLLISSLSAAATSSLLMWTVAGQRLEIPGAVTQYANRIGAGELAAIAARYPVAATVLAEGGFLTRLYREFTPAEMDADLVLAPADDQGEFAPIYYSGFPATGILLLLCALAALRPWRRPALIRAMRSVRPGRPPRGRGPGC